MSKKPSPYIASRNNEIRADFDRVCREHPDWTVKQICRHLHQISWVHLSPKTLENVCYPSGSGITPDPDSKQVTLF